MGQHYRMGLAIALAALVAGCGGGGSPGDNVAQAAAATYSRAASVDADTDEFADTPADENMAPELATPPPGLGDPCEAEADFHRVRSEVEDSDFTLVSRHVDCRVTRTLRMSFYVRLVSTGKDTWRFARDKETKNVWDFEIGSGTVETRFQTYGTSRGLVKKNRIQMRLVHYRPNKAYKGPSSNGLNVRPVMDCIKYHGGSCTFPTERRVGTISVPFSGEWSAVKEMPVRFVWVNTHTDPGIDYAEFRLTPMSFPYAVDGNPIFTDTPFKFQIASNSMPLIRCDRGMAVNGGSGCVMSAAAPVLKLSRATAEVAEAAWHIWEAQNLLSPGMVNPAPGRFVLKRGTRAVADQSVKGMNALHRAASDLRHGNPGRVAACSQSNASSIINLRPNFSATCPTGKVPDVCSCDEYPFNATYDNGALRPAFTSAKYISAAHNSESGTEFQKTLHWDRVLDFSTPTSTQNGEEFWVQID